jgi:hypothetical protein
MSKTPSQTQQMMEASTHMGLKAPGLLTFMVSFMIVMAVIFAKFFHAQIPGLNENTEFSGLLVAYVLLAAGGFFRAL